MRRRSNRKSTCWNIDLDILDRLDELADRRNINSVSELVNQLLAPVLDIELDKPVKDPLPMPEILTPKPTYKEDILEYPDVEGKLSALFSYMEENKPIPIELYQKAIYLIVVGGLQMKERGESYQIFEDAFKDRLKRCGILTVPTIRREMNTTRLLTMSSAMGRHRPTTEQQSEQPHESYVIERDEFQNVTALVENLHIASGQLIISPIVCLGDNCRIFLVSGINEDYRELFEANHKSIIYQITFRNTELEVAQSHFQQCVDAMYEMGNIAHHKWCETFSEFKAEVQDEDWELPEYMIQGNV